MGAILKTVVVVVIAASGAIAAGQTTAQGFPTKPIRLIVPSAAGGGPDTSARILAGELGKQIGRQVVVDNRPGASNIIGFEAIALSQPDGYTLGFVNFPVATNPSMYSKLPYDSAKDFNPVILNASTMNLLTVTPSLPARSVRELIDYARAHPGKLLYGAQGAGNSQQLSLELFKFMTGTEINPVFYKGIHQAILDEIAGQVHIVCDNLSSVLPHVKAGRIRALGVTALKRSAILPEMLTLDEAGIPGYELTPWSGFVVPARTPRDIVLRLNTDTNRVLLSPSVVNAYSARGTTLIGGTPEKFGEHIRLETEKWAKVIKAAGIRSN